MLEVDTEYLDKLTETFYLLLKGQPVSPVLLPPENPDDELRQLNEYITRFIEVYNSFSASMSCIARGELDFELPKGGMVALQQLKSLQASLRHLTWKTQQIAAGDFDQTVDFMGDFSTAFNSMTRQLREAFQKIERQNEELRHAYDVIKQEKEKSDQLLLNILPVRVADDLKASGQTVPRTFDNVTVLFTDIVGFTNLSSRLDPRILIDELNEIFTGFDLIIESNHCERIKTIGDAYLAVSGMNDGSDRHAENIIDSALGMIRFLEQRNLRSALNWNIRLGVHTGKVVGGVVGIRKYIYDVFGDTINTACRMEQHSEPMRINISETTCLLVRHKYECMERSELDVKGKGLMKMYFVTAKERNKTTPPPISA